MTAETHALRLRRKILLKRLAKAADEVDKIDKRLAFLLGGKRPGTGATCP